jgi:hypothetical protein
VRIDCHTLHQFLQLAVKVVPLLGLRSLYKTDSTLGVDNMAGMDGVKLYIILHDLKDKETADNGKITIDFFSLVSHRVEG